MGKQKDKVDQEYEHKPEEEGTVGCECSSVGDNKVEVTAKFTQIKTDKIVEQSCIN